MIRIALATLLTIFVTEAQQPLNSGLVLVTVTNKSDLELSLGLSLHQTRIPLPPLSKAGSAPTTAPVNQITEFQIRQTVQPQQQAVIQIPKGTYSVDASSSLPMTTTPSDYRLVRRSYKVDDYVVTNELWTFELESGTGASLDADDKVTQWKRKVTPVRTPSTAPNPSGFAPAPSPGIYDPLRQIPERTYRLAPGSSPVPLVDPLTARTIEELQRDRPPPPLTNSPEGIRSIPTRTLKLVPPP